MPDIIFKEVLIVDGGGGEPYVSDLRVSGERITEIGRIDPAAEDMVYRSQNAALCPGFIDAHGHSDYQMLVLPASDSKILQGVTTEVGGNCGFSAAPIFGELVKERAESLRSELNFQPPFATMEEFYAYARKLGLGMNFAPLVGYNTVRTCVIAYQRLAPDAKEKKVIRGEIEKAMNAGCYGMSAGLIYAPGCYTTAEELVAALEPVREAGGIFSCHIRSEGDRLLEAVEEFISIGRKAKVRLELSHLKTAGRRTGASWTRRSS